MKNLKPILVTALISVVAVMLYNKFLAPYTKMTA